MPIDAQESHAKVPHPNSQVAQWLNYGEPAAPTLLRRQIFSDHQLPLCMPGDADC